MKEGLKGVGTFVFNGAVSSTEKVAQVFNGLFDLLRLRRRVGGALHAEFTDPLHAGFSLG